MDAGVDLHNIPTWWEQEAVGQLPVLAVGAAALAVLSCHSGVCADTHGRNRRNGSHVLLGQAELLKTTFDGTGKASRRVCGALQRVCVL